MARHIKVVHKKVDAGKYDVFVNEERVGTVFKEWPEPKRYCWSHSEVPDKDIVEGKGSWQTRRGATLSLLIDRFFGDDSEHKKFLKELYVGK